MDITVQDVPLKHIKLFEELANVLGLKIKKQNQEASEEKLAIFDAIERVEKGHEENIKTDIDTLRKMTYANP